MELILLVLIAFLVAANLVFLFTQKTRSSENGPHKLTLSSLKRTINAARKANER